MTHSHTLFVLYSSTHTCVRYAGASLIKVVVQIVDKLLVTCLGLVESAAGKSRVSQTNHSTYPEHVATLQS